MYLLVAFLIDTFQLSVRERPLDLTDRIHICLFAVIQRPYPHGYTNAARDLYIVARITDLDEGWIGVLG